MPHSVPLMTLPSLEGSSSDCVRPLPTAAWEICSRTVPWIAPNPTSSICHTRSSGISTSVAAVSHLHTLGRLLSARTCIGVSGSEPGHFPEVDEKKAQNVVPIEHKMGQICQGPGHWRSEVFPGSTDRIRHSFMSAAGLEFSRTMCRCFPGKASLSLPLRSCSCEATGPRLSGNWEKSPVRMADTRITSSHPHPLTTSLEFLSCRIWRHSSAKYVTSSLPLQNVRILGKRNYEVFPVPPQGCGQNPPPPFHLKNSSTHQPHHNFPLCV